MNTSNFTSLNICKLVEQFSIEGAFESYKPFGSGHINDTFLIKNCSENCPDYLLQRINHAIFKDVASVVENISKVSAHLAAKLAVEFKTDKGREQVLTLIPTTQGALFFKDGAGNFWRLYQFIKDSISYDLVSSTKQAYEGGEAFGRFQRMLSDMNPDLLTETLPNFHNIKFRLENFEEALRKNSKGRVEEVAVEIELVEKQKKFMCTLYNMGQQGLLPKRITHNDSKFNNILFDKEDNVICIIDLDTVMPGYIAYDFGDAIRTLVNTAEEDEPDLTKVKVDLMLFKAYTKGYFKEAINFLTEQEIKSLYLAIFLFPYLQGLRFLTDYLNGDTYYKIAYPAHNLVRARSQFQLLKKLMEKKVALETILYETQNSLAS
ncbi:Ser/Thr protein kinase RdoA (MazF antagonist) [Pedobacter sp. UYEF25]